MKTSMANLEKTDSETKRFFVGGFDSSVTENRLFEYFSTYGNILKVEIIKKKSTGISMGYGFITASTKTAETILSKSHNINGRSIDLGKALTKQETAFFKNESYKKKIFIKNINPSTTTSGKLQFYPL